jgi:hypothetical protein
MQRCYCYATKRANAVRACVRGRQHGYVSVSLCEGQRVPGPPPFGFPPNSEIPVTVYRSLSAGWKDELSRVLLPVPATSQESQFLLSHEKLLKFCPVTSPSHASPGIRDRGSLISPHHTTRPPASCMSQPSECRQKERAASLPLSLSAWHRRHACQNEAANLQ